MECLFFGMLMVVFPAVVMMVMMVDVSWQCHSSLICF